MIHLTLQLRLENLKVTVLCGSQGKFTSKDGRVFEGELTYDQMMTHNLNGKRAPIPLCGKHLQYF